MIAASDRSLVQAGAWTPTQLVILLIVIGFAVRLAFAALVSLEVDGSYSTVIARQLSWSYFDHPPVHYWLVWLASHIFGSEAAIVVRLPFILMFAGSTWLLFRITADIFDDWAGLWAALILNLCPSFTLAFSIFVVPDGPVFFFMLLAVLFFSRIAFDTTSSDSLKLDWLAAGAAGGAAILAKYSGIFFFVGALVFVATVPRLRFWLRTPWPWAGAAIGAVIFSPVLIWNAQHEWISFLFQGMRATSSASGSAKEVYGNIVGQIGYLAPWFFLPMAVVLFRAGRRPSSERQWFFFCFAAGPIVAFTLLNFLQRGLPHWTLPGWLMTMPLLGYEIARFPERWRRLTGYVAAIGVVVIVAAFAIVALNVRTGVVAHAIEDALGRPVRDQTLDLYNWKDIEPELKRRGDLTADIKFLGSLNSTDTGKLGHALGSAMPLICLCDDVDIHHFRFMPDEAAILGSNGLIVAPDDVPAQRYERLRTRFARFDYLPDVVLYRGGRPALRFHVVRGIGLKPR